MLLFSVLPLVTLIPHGSLNTWDQRDTKEGGTIGYRVGLYSGTIVHFEVVKHGFLAVQINSSAIRIG